MKVQVELLELDLLASWQVEALHQSAYSIALEGNLQPCIHSRCAGTTEGDHHWLRTPNNSKVIQTPWPSARE